MKPLSPHTAIGRPLAMVGAILLLASLLAASGCRRNYKYYQAQPQIQVVGPTCQAQCMNAPNYLACFARCPGVVRESGTCSQMRLSDPNACVERREVSLGKTLLVFGVLGLIGLTAAAAAASATGEE